MQKPKTKSSASIAPSRAKDPEAAATAGPADWQAFAGKLADVAMTSLTGTTFDRALLDQAAPLLARLALQVGGTTTKDAKALSLNKPNNRLAFGRRRRGSRIEAVILLENDTGPAANEAVRYGIGSDGQPIQTLVIGQAHSQWPNDAAPKGIVPGNFDNEWRPGRSVAHAKKHAGTLGAFVTYKIGKNKKDYHGFVSCAHVLAPPELAQKNDIILSPGPPDQPRNPGTYGCGKLASWIELVHYENQSSADQVINNFDIAAVEFEPIADMPTSNLVPDPGNPIGNTIELKKVLSDDDILDLSDSGEVYMIGRTNGYAVGTIEVSAVNPYVIKLPNGRAYMYRDLVVVKPKDRKRGFSLPGDSGAPVYTGSGGLVGFVVGGTGNYTLVQTGACLAGINAQLI